MKKILVVFLLMCFTCGSVFAISFDTSVDADIRKNYNVEDNELPALPNAAPSSNERESKSPSKTVQVTKYNPSGKVYILKKGTKVNLELNNSITNWTPKGSIVSFTAKNGFCAKDGTIIPAGTIFKGKIVNSHPPQITGNGGLIELSINEIYFNGVKSFIQTKVSLADSKKVFLGNIKGKRSYWSNFSRAMRPGRKFFSATQSCAGAMAAIPVINLLSFVPLAGGAVVYAVNFVAAPFVSIFSKGGNLALPAGTMFQIKLIENSEIRG